MHACRMPYLTVTAHEHNLCNGSYVIIPDGRGMAALTALLLLRLPLLSALPRAAWPGLRMRTPPPLMTTPPSPPPQADLAKYADVALATIGAGSAIYLLDKLEIVLDVPLYAPPLAASTIIVFSGITPAPALNVFAGTIGAAGFALVLNELGGGSPFTRALAVSGSLAFFKLTGALFPPAAALAAVFLDSPALQERGWMYLLFPCISGQVFLYAFAIAVAQVRQRVRVAITQSQLDFSNESRESFREMFTRFDTSGDGRIDANELQVALRATIGADLDIADCDELVRVADTDGDGSIDFEEFMALLKFDPKINAGGRMSGYEKEEEEKKGA